MLIIVKIYVSILLNKKLQKHNNNNANELPYLSVNNNSFNKEPNDELDDYEII